MYPVDLTDYDAIPNSITRADVLNLGFNTLKPLDDESADKFIQASQTVLLKALGLKAIPTINVTSWEFLLANFVAAVFAVNKSGVVSTNSKSIRNFTISYGSIDMKNFYMDHQGLIGLFNQNHTAIMFDGGNWQSDDFPDGYRAGDINPDWPTGRWF